MAYEPKVGEVLEEVRPDTSQMPQTASDDGVVDKDAVQRWIDKGKKILESHLSGSAASLATDSGFGYDAVLDYACFRYYQAEGLDPEPHDQRWDEATRKIAEDPRSIASVQADEVVRSNAGEGGTGHWVDGDADGADFTGW